MFGRGAIDMKNMAALGITTMLELKRQDIKLGRDVVFVGCADEEDGSWLGAKWLGSL